MDSCGSLFVRCSVPEPAEAVIELQYLMMYDDAHADWGHRDNILRESHRAVNIGIASNGRRVTFVQHFEGGARLPKGRLNSPVRTYSASQWTKRKMGYRWGCGVHIL